MGSAKQLGRTRFQVILRGAFCASALIGTIASAAPVSSGHAGLAPAENRSVSQAFLNFLTLVRQDMAGAAGLQDFLDGEEGAAEAADLSAAPGYQPRKQMVDTLLGDLDIALRTLQESGEPETFLASQQADPGIYLTVALAGRIRNTVY